MKLTDAIKIGTRLYESLHEVRDVPAGREVRLSAFQLKAFGRKWLVGPVPVMAVKEPEAKP